jgi:tripartite-type tricarboxylate transporter receptor subunit TctC
VTDRATVHIGRFSALRHRCLALALALFSVMATLPPASAQAYPTKPVRLIVPYPAGASITAREIANALAQELGQQFVLDHRPGAAATMGHALVSRSAPDGYTIGIGTTGGLVSGPALLGNRIPYDSLKDFTHVGLATYIFYAMFVNSSSPAYSVADFIKLAKASPGSSIIPHPASARPTTSAARNW